MPWGDIFPCTDNRSFWRWIKAFEVIRNAGWADSYGALTINTVEKAIELQKILEEK
jgi:hypothetical protein